MIDQNLSQQLHSLAATVNEPFDLASLHRRISTQSRRRTAAKVGVAGAGVAAVVAGLIVVRDQRPGPAESGLAAASASLPSQVAATGPDCGVVLAGLRAAQSTPDSVVIEDFPTDKSASAGDPSSLNFKGVVTIITIDGPQLTFHNDEPKAPRATGGVGTVDAATVWVDGTTPLDLPPTLQVGEQVGLATERASDGVDHVIFVDVSAPAPAAVEKPVSDRKLATTGANDSKIVVPGPVLPPGPTAKAAGAITGVGATAISVTLDDASGQARTFDIDVASTPFYAGNTQCVPGSLTVGTALGVAYHFDAAGNVIGDAVMLMP